MLKWLFLLLFLTFNNLAFGQVYPHVEAEDNILNYWRYQRKLENYFITEPGNFYISGSGIPASMVDMCNPYIKWGDATIDLAWYIAKLALEYNLLSRTGEDTSIVVEKLFEELSTINRLDAFAEIKQNTFFGSNINLEGYFLRDDVGSPNGVSTPEIPYTLNQMSSDYKALFTGSNITSVQESQDQIIHLLMAMKCVKDWVPSSVTYKTAFDYQITSSIYDEAVEITNRLCYYSRDRKNWITNQIPHQWTWQIYDNAFSSLSAFVPVGIGANSLELSVGFNDSQEKIIDNSTASLPVPHLFNFPLIFYSWEDIGSIVKWFYAKNIWRTLQFLPLGQQEDIKVQMLAAIADNWHPYSMFFPQTTEAILLHGRAKMYDTEIIPLFYSVSHGAPCFYSSSYYWTMLNKATETGAYRYANNTYFPVDEWSSTQRFVHPERRYPGDWEWFRGDYNNLDYMLLFNLFYIKNWFDLPPYLNGFNANISNQVSFPYHGYGSVSEPYTVNAFKTIKAVNNIGTQTDVTYRAGEVIDLQDGFTTEAGAQFLAYISPFPEENIEVRCSTFIMRKSYLQAEKDVIDDENRKHVDEAIINIFPVPASESVTVNFGLEKECNVKIELYDLFNRHLQAIQDKTMSIGNHEFDFSISNVKPGTYFLHIKIGDDTYLTKKIIKL